MALVEARDLGKSFGGKVAVADLSFTVRPGVITGFLGPNGAGKSTTMRLMLGLDRGRGRTTFDGREFSELRHPLRVVGSLLEAKATHPTRSARNHLRMLAAANRIPNRRVDEVLELVGLASTARAKPKGFSLGMGQRLGLAAALLGDPHTLLLDEPVNGLDPQGIQWMRGLLRSLAAEGRSVLVSSHLLSEMALMADELIVVGRGRLIAQGTVAELVQRGSRDVVVVRTPDIALFGPALEAAGATVTPEVGPVVDTLAPRLLVSGLEAAAIGDLAHARGVRLHELAVKEATLEEAFFELTADAQEYAAPPPHQPLPGSDAGHQDGGR